MLLVLPLFPLPRWTNAPDPGPEWTNDLEAWALGILVVVVVGIAIGRLLRHARPGRWWLEEYDRVLVPALAVAIAVAAAATSQVVFRANPHLIDEMAQLLHARAFAAGRLALPRPEPGSAFLITHTFVTDFGWVSQYPPGQTALLAIGLLLGVEWLVNPVLAGLTLIAVHQIARGLYGPRVARAAAVLWALSAWVLFMGSTFLNHVGAVAFGAAAWALVFAPGRVGRVRLAVAGAAVVAAAATRPLDGVAVLIPMAVWCVHTRRWREAPWVALGGIPVAAAWAYFNWRLFGAPWAMGYTELYGPEHGMGFHIDPWGQPFTPLVAMSNLGVAVRRLHSYVFEWPIPALLPLGLWAFLARHRSPSDRVLVAGILSAPFLYFFYWHSGYYLGPRFYFAIAPWLVLGTACAWRWSRGVAGARGRRSINWSIALTTSAGLIIAWGYTSVLPGRWSVYSEGLPSFKLHAERELAAAGIEQAVVLIPTSWGNRVVAGLWDLGVPPGLVERAYRRLDLCRLDRVRRYARAEQWSPDSTALTIERMVDAQAEPAPVVAGWPDPTLRLSPGSALSPECRTELASDLEGIGTYENLAWRNSVDRKSGLVFARDLQDANPEIIAAYPGWAIWRYLPPKVPGGNWQLLPVRNTP